MLNAYHVCAVCGTFKLCVILWLQFASFISSLCELACYDNLK